MHISLSINQTNYLDKHSPFLSYTLLLLASLCHKVFLALIYCFKGDMSRMIVMLYVNKKWLWKALELRPYTGRVFKLKPLLYLNEEAEQNVKERWRGAVHSGMGWNVMELDWWGWRVEELVCSEQRWTDRLDNREIKIWIICYIE